MHLQKKKIQVWQLIANRRLFTSLGIPFCHSTTVSRGGWGQTADLKLTSVCYGFRLVLVLVMLALHIQIKKSLRKK